MIRTLALAALIAAPALAQMTPGVGSPAPYAPAGTTPAIGSATPSPVGVTPPAGDGAAGTIGDGRVGTLAPGAPTPGVTGQLGTRTTTGVSATTPTTNPPPR